jgi:hypothetical protein
MTEERIQAVPNTLQSVQSIIKIENLSKKQIKSIQKNQNNFKKRNLQKKQK